jgi:hypothetical protein
MGQLGIDWPSLGYWIFESIANSISDLEPLIEISISGQIKADCLKPLIEKAICQQHKEVSNWLSKTATMIEYQRFTTELILSNYQYLEDLLPQIWDELGKHAKTIGINVYRNEYDIDLLRRIAKHPDKNLLREILLYDVRSDKQTFLIEDRSLWIETFERATEGIDTLDYLYDQDKLFKKVPETRFLIARQIINTQEYVGDREKSKYEDLFSGLDTSEKLEILRQLNSNTADTMIGLLIGFNIELYRGLLEDSSMSVHHIAPIRIYSPSKEWIDMLLLALEFGLEESDIVLYVNPMTHSYHGHGVEHYQGIIDSYAILPEHENEQVQNIGKSLIKHIERHLDEAKASEERERIYGIRG